MCHFCPPGSGPGFRIRIQIHWPDWIRIQSGSGYGTGSATLLFANAFHDANKKCFFSKLIFFFFFTVASLTSVFKDNMSLKSHEKVEVMVYLYFFACWWKDPDPDPRGTKTCGSHGSKSLFKFRFCRHHRGTSKPYAKSSLQDRNSSIWKRPFSGDAGVAGRGRGGGQEASSGFLSGSVHLSQCWAGRCRLSWLINSALVFEPKCGGRGGVAGSQPMSTAVHHGDGAQINFGDLTPSVTYGVEDPGGLSRIWIFFSIPYPGIPEKTIN